MVSLVLSIVQWRQIKISAVLQPITSDYESQRTWKNRWGKTSAAVSLIGVFGGELTFWVFKRADQRYSGQ